MIRDPAALDAMIVNNVSKSLFTHTRDRLSGVYQAPARDARSVSISPLINVLSKGTILLD
jgi:hypothetical protein